MVKLSLLLLQITSRLSAWRDAEVVDECMCVDMFWSEVHGTVKKATLRSSLIGVNGNCSKTFVLVNTTGWSKSSPPIIFTQIKNLFVLLLNPIVTVYCDFWHCIKNSINIVSSKYYGITT